MRFTVGLVSCLLLVACGGEQVCEQYPALCQSQGGSPAAGGGGGTVAGGGGSGGAPRGGGGEGGGGGCAEPCIPGDVNTTATCVNETCEYACIGPFTSCDNDPSTCETPIDEDGNCGGCGVDCAYDDCTQIDGVFACNDPIDIRAGDFHTCAIKRDRTLWCWGNNSLGQLGTPTINTNQFTPIQIMTFPPGFEVAYQAQGNHFGCAQSPDKQLACWPAGTLDHQSASAQIISGANVNAIAYLALGRRDSDAAGDSAAIVAPNGDFVYFDYDNGASSALTLVPFGEGAGTVVASSGRHYCFVRLDGTLACKGRNDWGQIGNGNGGPNQVALSSYVHQGTFQDVGVGLVHTCALPVGGLHVTCFGRNVTGAFDGTDGVFDDPVEFFPTPSPLISLAVGPYHNAVISAQDKLFLFGNNNYNQVSPQNGDITSPVEFVLPPGDIPVQAALGVDHTCVLLRSGFVKCWGRNNSGQLGNGGNVNQTVPVTTMF